MIWFAARTTSPTAEPPVAVTTPAVPTPQGRSAVLSETEQGRVDRALATGRLELPANMNVLSGHTGTSPGAGDAAAPLSPATPRATALTEPRPQFAWTPLPGATRYSVKVFDERFREVARSGALKTTTWTPPRALPRGRVLAWQISAATPSGTITSPAPPQPEARFLILDADTVAALAKTRERLTGEPVALALALAKLGLFAEAEAALESALTHDRFDKSQVRALLTRLRAR